MSDVERELRELGERTAEQIRHGEIPRRRIVRRVRLRRGAAVAGACAVVALAAAVAIPRLDDVFGRDQGVTGGVDLAAVAQTTEDAGTARMELEMVTAFSSDGVTARGAGVTDFESGRSRFVMEETLATEGRLEIVTIGGSTFQRLVAEPGETAGKWYETEMPGGGNALGMDPSDPFSYLRTVSDEVTNLGKETLDGVQVTRYRAEIEPPDMGSVIPDDMQVEMEPMDVWVDEHGRLRRFTFGVTTEGPAGEGSIHMTMRLWDFGVPVDVAAPDPADVTDEAPPWLGMSSGDEAIPGDETPPLPSTTAVVGAAEFREDYLVISGGRFGLSCVRTRRDDASSAQVVDDETGEVILEVGPDDFEAAAGSFGSGMGCVRGAPSHVDELFDHPDRYTLRVQGDGWHSTVPLVLTHEPAGSSR